MKSLAELALPTMRTVSLIRTLPNAAGDAVDLGSFTLNNGGGALDVALTVPSVGFSLAKRYLLPVPWTADTGWRIAQPISDTGGFSGNDVALDVRIVNNVTSLRVRRSAGSTSGLVRITILHSGDPADVWTPSTATATVAAPTAYVPNAIASQRAGTLSVAGNVEAALSATTGGFRQGPTGPTWLAGAGSPEGVVTAPIGSMYSRTDGAADTAVYRKETGTGNTGWVPIADVYVNVNAPPGTPNVGDLWYDTDEPSTALAVPVSVVNGGTGASTPAAARTNLAMPGEELAYNQVTAIVAITSTAAAAANVVVEGTSRSYDGSPVLVEFFCGAMATPTGAVNGFVCIDLWDGATDIGQFAFLQTPVAGAMLGQIHAKRRLTPTVGTHNYRIGGWCTGAGAAAYAGVGGAGQWLPMYVRVTRA